VNIRIVRRIKTVTLSKRNYPGERSVGMKGMFRKKMGCKRDHFNIVRLSKKKTGDVCWGSGGGDCILKKEKETEHKGIGPLGKT